MLFTDVELALGRNPASANIFTTLLAADNGGKPGATLDAITLSKVVPSDIPTAPTPTRFTAAQPVRLLANTRYWIVGTTTGDTEINWYLNQTEAGNSVVRNTNVNGGAWDENSFVDPAFRVNGIAAPAAAVPEPGTAALALVAILPRVGMVRRRCPADCKA